MTMNEKRMAKYPNTKYFKFSNLNYKDKITGDCSIRAIAAVLGIGWKEAYDRLFFLSRDLGETAGSRKTLDKLLLKEGFIKMKQPKHSDNTKVTCKELIDFYNKLPTTDQYVIFASVGSHHVLAIYDSDHLQYTHNYKVHDIWDSSNEKIGAYYIKSITDSVIYPSTVTYHD